MRSLVVLVLAVALMEGCALQSASHPISGSYIEVVPGIDPTQLAQQLTTYLAGMYPPANTTFILMQPAADQPDNLLAPALTSALSKAGFAVADLSTATSLGKRANVHHVRYRVSTFDDRALVELDIDDRTITRLYAPDKSGLVAAVSASAVRESD
jgi:hypothetical protein